jgi:hypothetical protein
MERCNHGLGDGPEARDRLCRLECSRTEQSKGDWRVLCVWKCADAEVWTATLHNNSANFCPGNDLRYCSGEVLGKFWADSVEMRSVSKLNQSHAFISTPGCAHVWLALKVTWRKVEIRGSVKAAHIGRKHIVQRMRSKRVHVKIWWWRQ